MRLTFAGIGLALTIFLAAAVALFSLRYALPAQPLTPPDVRANPFAVPWLPIHAVSAAIALLVGGAQFVRSRSGGRARWHRRAGAVYMACCFVGAPAGLVLALGSKAGPVAVVGFSLLALAWTYTTARGLQAVLGGRYAEHGRWMLRSYALAFSAVTLRLYLPWPPMLGIDSLESYRAIAWLCWVPNLVAVEVFMATGGRPLALKAAA